MYIKSGYLANPIGMEAVRLQGDMEVKIKVLMILGVKSVVLRSSGSEHGGSRLIRNDGTYFPGHAAPNTRTQYSTTCRTDRYIERHTVPSNGRRRH